jgi:hypothetical protein
MEVSEAVAVKNAGTVEEAAKKVGVDVIVT